MKMHYSTDNECLLSGGLWALIAALFVGCIAWIFMPFTWAVALSIIVFAVSFLIAVAMCKTRTVGRGGVDVTAVELARAEMGMAAPSINEPEAEPEPEPEAAAEPAQEELAEEVSADEAKPELLSEARGGQADDLKKIKGVGPKLEKELNDAGVYHFDQIAGWTAEEVDWADNHLVSFKGRVSRDNWVDQAKELMKK